jgi:hypothetical protein
MLIFIYTLPYHFNPGNCPTERFYKAGSLEVSNAIQSLNSMSASCPARELTEYRVGSKGYYPANSFYRRFIQGRITNQQLGFFEPG